MATITTVIDPSTRIIDLTVGQLQEILAKPMEERVRIEEKVTERRKAYGIAGIAETFNCSMTTANRIKRSGRIDNAITQYGRTIVIDVEKALESFNKNR